MLEQIVVAVFATNKWRYHIRYTCLLKSANTPNATLVFYSYSAQLLHETMNLTGSPANLTMYIGTALIAFRMQFISCYELFSLNYPATGRPTERD